jgi:hypothetical protein
MIRINYHKYWIPTSPYAWDYKQEVVCDQTELHQNQHSWVKRSKISIAFNFPENVKLKSRFTLKFMFSTKATKNHKIFTIDLTITKYLNVKSTVKISKIFMAFLENMNFNRFDVSSKVRKLPIPLSKEGCVSYLDAKIFINNKVKFYLY